MHGFLRGPVAVMVHVVQVAVMVPVVVVVVVACVCLLDGSSHAKLRQPVHGGQATLEFGGHVSHRLKGEEETETLGAVALGRITWLTGRVLCSSLGSSLEEQEVCLLCRLIFNWSADTQMLTCTLFSSHTETLCAGKKNFYFGTFDTFRMIVLKR